MSAIVVFILGAAAGIVATTFVGAISVWVKAQKEKF